MTIYTKSKNFKRVNHARGLAILSILIIFSMLFLGVLYIIQINSLVDYSYQIRQQKEQLRNLQAENQALEMEIVQLQSPANLEELVRSLGMVDAGQAIYLEDGRVMAMKE